MAYTPTLENTVSNLDEKRISYEQLVANNFHQTKRCPYKVKNRLKENGNLLIEFCKLHNLLITSTIFKHKPNRQTTWISLLASTFPRKSPYRNQIVDILL